MLRVAFAVRDRAVAVVVGVGVDGSPVRLVHLVLIEELLRRKARTPMRLTFSSPHVQRVDAVALSGEPRVARALALGRRNAQRLGHADGTPWLQ